MRRATWITACALGLWICGAGVPQSEAGEDFVFYHEDVMGTSLELRVGTDDAEAARWAEGRALGEIDRLSAIFSGYDPSSEFRRWQAGPKGPVKVSPELFEVLRACDSWRERTVGAFDPRVQALTRLWSSCAKQGRTPRPDELAEATERMKREAWRLDPSAGTAEYLADGPLSLDGIAKGFIVGKAAEAALDRARGIRGVLLNVGGDLRVVGDLARTVGIAPPLGDSEASEPIAYVEVRGRALATSGSSQRGLRINGRWYSHIFDPRTGRPADRVLAATVVADRSADADALATAFNVLEPEQGVRLANSLPDVECLILSADGRVARSDGWDRLERPKPLPVALADAPKAPSSKPEAKDKTGESKKAAPKAKVAEGDSWGKEFELLIDFEINRPEPDPEGRRYRRPYVAVWVEDKDGFPVRNLVLWISLGGPGPFQWLPDLKRWYRADQARRVVDKRDMITTISRPTRPPGKYSVIWDGKDDHGKPVPPGEYTVFIDAARENGTYQGLRQPVVIDRKPFAEELKGNVEIKSATIEYRRKSPRK